MVKGGRFETEITKLELSRRGQAQPALEREPPAVVEQGRGEDAGSSAGQASSKHNRAGARLVPASF